MTYWSFRFCPVWSLPEIGTDSPSSSLPLSWMKISKFSLLWCLSKIPFPTNHIANFPKSKTKAREVTAHLKVTWQVKKRAWMSAPRFLSLTASKTPPEYTFFSFHFPIFLLSLTVMGNSRWLPIGGDLWISSVPVSLPFLLWNHDGHILTPCGPEIRVDLALCSYLSSWFTCSVWIEWSFPIRILILWKTFIDTFLLNCVGFRA